MTSCMCGEGRREKGREEEGGWRQEEGEAEREEEKMRLRLYWKFLFQGGLQTQPRTSSLLKLPLILVNTRNGRGIKIKTHWLKNFSKGTIQRE